MNRKEYPLSSEFQDLSENFNRSFDEVFLDLEEERFIAKHRRYSLHSVNDEELFLQGE